MIIERLGMGRPRVLNLGAHAIEIFFSVNKHYYKNGQVTSFGRFQKASWKKENYQTHRSD